MLSLLRGEATLTKIAGCLQMSQATALTDPAALQAIAEECEGLLSAVVQVHLYGHPCDMLEILSLRTSVLASDIPASTALLPSRARAFHAGNADDLKTNLEGLAASEGDDSTVSAARDADEACSRFAGDRIDAGYESVYEQARMC